MVERIPRGVPIHSWLDRLIHEAEERGEFDDLPGFGKPLPGLDKPVDENWWLNQKIQEEEVPSDVLLPPALQLRRELADLPRTVADLPDEDSVRAVVAELNQRVAEFIRSPSGPVLPVGPVSAEDIVAGWRARRNGSADIDTPVAGASTPIRIAGTKQSGTGPLGDEAGRGAPGEERPGAGRGAKGATTAPRRPWWRRWLSRFRPARRAGR